MMMTTKRIRKIISFRPEKGECDKFRKLNDCGSWDAFYFITHPWDAKSHCWHIAEHHDSSPRDLPEPGYRLTESVPDEEDMFRDNGWEVTRVITYKTDDPEADYQIFAIAYCKYEPLPIDKQWTKKAHRI
jgi:hypothetical protein